MLVFDRSNLGQHVPWIVGCLVVTAVATIWFFAASMGNSAWPSGSSVPGFTFGVLGGLICLFEFLLWPRKKFRTWRVGRTLVWMRAHIWLGLLAVPLLVYHTGFRWGGPLSFWLMILFLVVVASGIWGLVVQQFLPRQMLDNIPAETIYSQINRLAGQLNTEAEILVLATCGPEPGEKPRDLEELEELATTGTGHLVVGAVRTAGRVQGKVLETRTPQAIVPNSDLLRMFYRDTLRPYLEKGGTSGSALRQGARAQAIFSDLRTRLPFGAHAAVDALENMATQRRQFDLQKRLHFWLHNWLCIHLPLSVALIVLMFVHIFVALKYW